MFLVAVKAPVVQGIGLDFGLRWVFRAGVCNFKE